MIDLQSPEVIQNPFPSYTVLREQYPVSQVDPGNLWALSRFGDVQYALKNHTVFTSTKKSELLAPELVKKRM